MALTGEGKPGIRRLGSSALIFIFLVGTAAAAENDSLEVNVSASYYSKYVWRGQNINNSSVLQPSVSGSIHGFTGFIWANIDLAGQSQTVPDNAGEFSEAEYSVEYSAAMPGLKKMGFTAGAIQYYFPSTAMKSTTEIYGSLSMEAFLKPRITWYGDVNAVDGSYLQLSLQHKFAKVIKRNNGFFIDLDLTGSFGWASSGYNKSYFNVDAGTFNDVSVTVGMPIQMRHLIISPSVNISAMPGKQIGHAVLERNNVWFGIGLERNF